MRYTLKLFLIYFQIILQAKNLFILLDKYNPKQMEVLLRKLYRKLPEKEVDEERFVHYFMTYFRLLEIIVDFLWTFFPQFMHQLTWKYLATCRVGWEWFFKQISKYAQESTEVLNAKKEAYTKLYNERVMLNLLQKDFEIQIQQFDFWFKIEVNKQIKEMLNKLNNGKLPSEEENWLFYIDENGIRVNPKWNINR